MESKEKEENQVSERGKYRKKEGKWKKKLVYLCIYLHESRGLRETASTRKSGKAWASKKDSEPSKALRNGPEISKNHENPQNRV